MTTMTLQTQVDPIFDAVCQLHDAWMEQGRVELMGKSVTGDDGFHKQMEVPNPFEQEAQVAVNQMRASF